LYTFIPVPLNCEIGALLNTHIARSENSRLLWRAFNYSKRRKVNARF